MACRNIHSLHARRLGRRYRGVPFGGAAACCGALAMHAGREDEAKRAATATMRALTGDAPIVVDSPDVAPCQGYGHLFGTDEPPIQCASSRYPRVARATHRHVARTHVGSESPLPFKIRAIYATCSEPHLAVRRVLAPFRRHRRARRRRFACRAGGAVPRLHPDLAGDIRDRKIADIGRSAPRPW